MINFKKFYKNKKVLITGATGFKGAWLTYWLYKMGANITGIGFNPNKNKNLFYQLKLDRKIDLKIVDVRNFKKLNNIVVKHKPQIIFHLAAQPLIMNLTKIPCQLLILILEEV